MDGRLRIIDANLNRAREALRVMEDVARLGLGSEALCRRIKEARHELSRAAARLPGGEVGLLANRDTAGDVGTGVSTAAEGQRAGLRDIASAACKRLTEALRVLEECAKVDAPEAARMFGIARYGVYDLERHLLLAFGSGRGVQWRLCVLITESLCQRPWLEVARAALEGGADCLQLREKGLSDAELLRRARELRVLTGGRAALVINDRVDIALACGANGVHLGEKDLPIRAVRALAGDRLLIGASTHSLAEAHAVAEAGADYCGVGPMFATSTKAREVAGPAYLRQYVVDPRLASVPHLAIGGITPDNVRQLAALGCRGVAVSHVVCAADDPRAVCEGILNAAQGVVHPGHHHAGSADILPHAR